MSSAAPASLKKFAFVGSFTTTERKARGRGIEVYRIDAASGRWTLAEQVGDIVNPSFLHADPVRNVLYAAHGDCDFASAYAVDPATGRLRFLARERTGGLNGVSLTLDPSRRFLIVVNHSGGSVAVLPVGSDGALEPLSHCIQLPCGAAGPHGAEPKRSRPHDAVFDPSGRFLLIPDKGADHVVVTVLDPGQGKLRIANQAALRPASGPRHIAFHSKRARAFVVNELDSTVATCRWEAETGILMPINVVPALAPDFFGASTAAEIVVTPCGRFVYASNRGQDVVTHFALDETGNNLKAVGWTPTQGQEPRFMCLAPQGDRLLVANEQGDTIVAFAMDPATGALSPAGLVVETPSPSAIAFL